MSFDVLFISSDSQSAGNFDRDKFSFLSSSYGMSDKQIRQLLFADAPWWKEGDVPMSYVAAENWFRNDRNFSLSPAEVEKYFSELSNDTLTRFGNGLYVTSHLIKEGMTARLINNLATSWQTFLDYVEEGPRVIAISTTFLESREAAESTARRIREIVPDVPIVIGGPLVLYSHKIMTDAPRLHPHLLIQATYWFSGEKADPAVDALVIDSRGEATLAEIVRRVRDGRPWKDLPNLAYADENRDWHINPRVPEFVDVNEEGVVWSQLPDEFLGREVGVRGSRGCPLRCKFCSFVVIHPEFEMKKVDVFREELRELSTRSDIIKHVSFVDDNLFLTRRSVYQYTKMMVEEKFPFTWSAFVRVDSVDEQNAQLMKEAGCTFLMLGIESGDLGVLKTMRKVQRPERVLRTMNLLSDVGISTLSTLVVGFPTETPESIDRTIAMLNAYPDRGSTMHWFNCWVHTVIPLVPVDKEREKWNLHGIQLDWRHDTMDVAQAFHERERLLASVNRGGAYNGPYPFDATESFEGAGEAGFQDMRKFYKLRHRVGCLDYFGDEKKDGFTREETLREVQELVLRTAERNGK